MLPRPDLRRAAALASSLGVLAVVPFLASAQAYAGSGAVAAAVSSLQVDMTSGDPVDSNASGDLNVGDTIVYTFTVTNTGTEPVRDVVVTDHLDGLAQCPPSVVLEPGDRLQCHETYKITQADLDTGTVDNTAAARGAISTMAEVFSPTDSTSTTLAAVASLSLSKDSETPIDSNQSGRIDAGDVVTFVYEISNTGDLTLHDLAVVDPTVIGASCEVLVLPPGASTRCGGRHAISQSDIDSGALTAESKATALSPGGSEVSSPSSATTTVIPASPSITLGLRALLVDADGDGLADVGEQIRYTFVVSNSGSTTLTGIVISDPMLKAAGDAVGCPVDALNAGETVTCTATHTVTDHQVDEPLVDTADVRATASTVVTSPFASAVVQTDRSGSHRSLGASAHVTTWVVVPLAVLVLAGSGLLLSVRRRRRRTTGTPGP